MKEKDNDVKEEEGEDLSNYDRFPKLPCQVLRRHVFHGVKEENGVQTILCLSCGDKYELHKDGRNKIEKSLWEKYEKFKDEVDLSPPPEKRPKKRWNRKYLFFRG